MNKAGEERALRTVRNKMFKSGQWIHV